MALVPDTGRLDKERRYHVSTGARGRRGRRAGPESGREEHEILACETARGKRGLAGSRTGVGRAEAGRCRARRRTVAGGPGQSLCPAHAVQPVRGAAHADGAAGRLSPLCPKGGVCALCAQGGVRPLCARQGAGGMRASGHEEEAGALCRGKSLRAQGRLRSGQPLCAGDGDVRAGRPQGCVCALRPQGCVCTLRAARGLRPLCAGGGEPGAGPGRLQLP